MPQTPRRSPTTSTPPAAFLRPRGAGLPPAVPALFLAAVGLVALLAAAPAAAAELDWQSPGDEAHTMAERDGLPLLYYFTASWCAPCHQLKRAVFDDAERAAGLAGWYTLVEVQDTVYEEGENAPAVNDLIRRYRVASYPTLVVAAPDGTEIATLRGYPGPERVWSFLESHRGGAEAVPQKATTQAR